MKYEVTLIITACDRNDLLKRTLESFVKFNTYPIKKLIIRDDSGLQDVYEEMAVMLCNINLPFPFEIMPVGQFGQAKSIELLMSEVTTPYVFHCEDDWEFFDYGFIEKSLEILKNKKNILQVWIRPVSDISLVKYGKLRTIKDIDYRIVVRDKDTSGFTCNPHLKRKADFVPYSVFLSEIPDGLTEHKIGDYYYKLGFKSAWLIEGYCHHIGDEKSTYRPSSYRQGARKL